MLDRSSRGLDALTTHALLGIGAAAIAAGSAYAEIDVTLRPLNDSAAVGETVRMGCYLSADTVQEYCCMTIALDWDPAQLRLIDADQTGAEGAQMAWWPEFSVPWTLNETTPPQDGTGLYIVLAALGSDEMATPQGVLVSTFEFEALAPGMAEVGLGFEGPGVEDATIIWDGVIPNLQVTGELTSGAVTIGSSASTGCPSDITGDNEVGIDDVLEVFNNWQDPYTVDDLVSVLMNFGPCS